ncbi:MAG: hypothetical protein COV48_13995, partial [Elusimicrobia bacterium CG11_big_fil_rev_8_21_14_0_20_64_6]
MKRALFLLLLSSAAAAATFNPSPLLNMKPEPEKLMEDCRAAKKRAQSALERVARMPKSVRTFDNTPWALDLIASDLTDQTGSSTFLKYVSVSSAVRESANECETLLGQFAVDVYSREDLNIALKEYANKKELLTPEAARLVSKELLDFKRSGLELPRERRQEVSGLRKKLVELEALFSRNINEHRDYALFDKTELGGMPEDFVNRLEHLDGKYMVGLDYPDYFPFMDNSTNPEARKLLENKFNNRAAFQNIAVLKDILALRFKAARLLGYPTHAHFVLESRMAANPRTVASFLARLRRKLRPLGIKELAKLKTLKREQEGKAAAKRINAWDWRFYDNQLKKTDYAVDAQKIKEYFPVDLVTSRMLEVYQNLLGLDFRRIDNPAVWHPDVELYEIRDAGGREPIAHFYLDLYPRKGKYKHAAAFAIITGRRLPDGRYQKPVSAMVANFDKPAKNRPSLLTHDEVETFF